MKDFMIAAKKGKEQGEISSLRATYTVWHPTLLSKLSVCGIQGQLHTWLTGYLYSCSQHVALNGILSSALPVKAGGP